MTENNTAYGVEVVDEQKSVAVQQPQGLSPLVQAAMAGQLDTQKLSELLAIQKEFEANEARKAFHLALAEFKRFPLTIYKDKHVKYTSQKGTTEYDHATLGAALDEINPLLGKCGLSLTWDTKQGESGDITVTAILSHAMGHSITTSLQAAPDDSGGKNKIQAVGSSVEYLKRYTGFLLLGISSRDMDDDGRGKGSETSHITDDQCNEIQAMIDDNNLNHDGTYLPAFLKWIKSDSLSTIPAKDFNKAKAGVAQAIAKRAKK